jgi:DNA-binding transcriptional regulator YiaG
MAQQLAIPVRKVSRWQERESCPAGGTGRIPRADKQDRFEHIKELRLRDLSQKEIAIRLARGLGTVQRWQKREDGPASQPRRKGRSIFDPYASYVLSRWEQGSRDIGQLFREIQEQGFKGSIGVLSRGCRKHFVNWLGRFLRPQSWTGLLSKKSTW